MEKSDMVLVGVLALVVLVAGVQAFQFYALSDSLSNLDVSGAGASAPAPRSSGSGGASASASTALANLPTQVGGC